MKRIVRKTYKLKNFFNEVENVIELMAQHIEIFAVNRRYKCFCQCFIHFVFFHIISLINKLFS